MNRKFGAIGRTLWALALACSAIAGAKPACSAPQRDEREVRSAYVFNLVKYVEWPPSRNEILIGYIGDAESGAVMQKLLSGRNSDEHTLRVVVMPTEEELTKCSVVYVADAKQAESRKLLDRLKEVKVLTIGESEAFVRDGGVVALIKADDHIQIQVNLEAAQRAGVRISSRVLNLATIVHSAQNERN